MKPRALAATLLVPLGLLGLAACGSDDDASLTVRTEAPTTESPTTEARTTSTRASTTTTDEDTTTSSTRRTTTTSSDDATTTTSTGGSSTSSGGPTQTYPAPIRAVFVQTFESLGLTQDQADCAVGVVEQRVPYEDLLSGDFSALVQDTGFARALQDTCGIDASDLSGVTTSTTG